MTFRALVIRQEGDEKPQGNVETLEEATLPEEGDVLVAIEYSALNYKDGLCMAGAGGLVRKYPHIPGVDMAGVVLESTDKRYKQGDKVLLTGWRYGEIWWGGYAEKTRVKADWLVPLPDSLTTRQAMAIGTAGFTAILAVDALARHDITPERGPVLVTGAAGGVGSVAVSILARLGYEVAAVTGRPETGDYLKSLGAKTIIPRAEMAEASSKPMESGRWAGCIENVGGDTLARVLGQMDYGGAVASIGNASGIAFSTNVLPFILRGVNLLGIDSVMQPYDRRVTCWDKAAELIALDQLEGITQEAGLEDMMKLGAGILKGQVKGRVIVNPQN